MDNFKQALSEVLKDEGGYSNHPKDPGGATNYGIIQRVYDAYRTRVGMPAQSVKQISRPEVEAIYRASYWDLGKCGSLPDGVDYVVFDGCVNSGVKQSIKWLQRALAVKDDGIIGPATIAAAKAYPDHALLVEKICDLRLKFLQALSTWSTFGRGWSRRVARVRNVGKVMATGNIAFAQPLLQSVPAPAKAYASDAAMPPSPAIGDAMTGAGTFGGILTQTIEQLTPLSQIEFVGRVIAILTVGSVLLALAGIAYSMWSRYRKAKVKDAIQAGT